MGEGSGEPGVPFPVAQWTLAAPADHWAVPVRGVGSVGCAHRGPRELKGLGKVEVAAGTCDIALCRSTEGAWVGFGNVELELCLSLVQTVPSSVSALVLFGIGECCREGSSRCWSAPGRLKGRCLPCLPSSCDPWSSSAVQHRCHRHGWIHVGGLAVSPESSTSGCGDTAVP